MTSYILFNTLIYGSIAFILASYFAYGKYLNASLGSFMILGTYAIIRIVKSGRSRESLIVIVSMIILYIVINFIVLHYFRSEKQRDLFGLIFTFGSAIFLENSTSVLFGPTSTSISVWEISTWYLVIALIVINTTIIYAFHRSYTGKIRKGIYTNTPAIRALWVNTNSMLQKLFMLFLPCLLLIGFVIANESTLRASDNLFYLIKWIGIMIMVWLEKKELIYVGALLYVVMEYLLFIQRWVPLSYKEALILVIILVILLARPQWLFSIRSRKI